jgi:hypothetical protein
MKANFRVVVGAVWVLVLGTGLLAHHSFSTEYDGTKTFSFSGTVTKVEWTNPHVRFYVDVKDDSGTVSNWNMELASPSALARNGWTSRTLKVGEQVKVAGYAAKVAPNRGNVRSVVTADGRSLFGGAADDDAPVAR